MFIRYVDSDVAKHAIRQGCVRGHPFQGLCVDCPVQATCPVLRIPLPLWTTRVTLTLGRAEALMYLNDLTLSPLSPESRSLPSGRVTHRRTAVEVPCGWLLVKEPPQGASWTGIEALDLASYLTNGGSTGCGQPVVMDEAQVRHHHFSNWGRKTIVAVQACSKECAEVLSGVVNQNFRATTDLLRRTRVPGASGRTPPQEPPPAGP